MVGIQKPRNQAVNSNSLAKYLFDETNQYGLREHLGICRTKNGGSKFSALRNGKMKLVYDHKTSKSELYDLSRDRSEERDVSAQNEFLVKEMKQLLRQIGPYALIGKETLQ